jgi:ATP-dependent helicase/nuclease subunit A
LRAALDDEMRARRREELNGLYVAMSRAKHRLVFSATEPYLAQIDPSWWARVAAVVSPWPSGSERPDAVSDRGGGAATVDAPAVKVLPLWREAGARVANADVAAAAADAPAARLGRAVHRALEWAGHSQVASPEVLAAAAARDFGVAAPAVRHHVEAILGHPDGARFFHGPQIRWSGNEVSVSHAGELLRIDRLVLLDRDGAGDGETGAVWWVLDYKLSHAPHELEPYRQQLLRYRAAITEAQPGESVRCAFVTGAGQVIEIA